MLGAIIVGVLNVGINMYLAKEINESKGYTGGALWGFLTVIGLAVVTCKKELPNARPYAFRAATVIDVFKKYRYPFAPLEFEPISMFKGSIQAEADAAKANLVFLILHGLFMIMWYGFVFAFYEIYLFFRGIKWLPSMIKGKKAMN